MTQFQLKIGVIGLGYVGLPSAAGFAEMGFSVIGTDSDPKKLATLHEGRSPLYEPGLQELLDRHTSSGRLRFVEDIASVVREATVLFICVGTPQAQDGQADLSQVDGAVKEIARHLDEYRIIVEKSTVPVTTADWIKKTVSSHTNGIPEFDVASNPEFLREGSAVADFLNPDRIVLGVESERARSILEGLYTSFYCPVFVTDLSTVEIIKHASNSFLAMRVSFINMISDLCEATGADVNKVAEGMGLDPRIGHAYLEAGIGYGGYCLPKDIRGFIHIGEQMGVDFSMLKAVEDINDRRVDRLLRKIEDAAGQIEGLQIGVLGLAFKSGTDDTRVSPSISVVQRLQKEGAKLRLHDPQAIENTRNQIPDSPGLVVYCDSAYEAAEGCDALLLLTGWPEYRELDLTRLNSLMSSPVIIDGRNYLEPAEARSAGFQYSAMGRP